nr:immunoglobulin light chain junction region [Macaca mulatta]
DYYCQSYDSTLSGFLF